MPAGRPPLYTKELGDKICFKIMEGISVHRICQDESMPCPATLYKWLRTEPEFLENYREAKENQADLFVEQLLEIPDTEEDVQRAKLKVDVRKWAASRFNAKKYGDRVDMNMGGQKDNPIVHTLADSDKAALDHYIKTRGNKDDA